MNFFAVRFERVLLLCVALVVVLGASRRRRPAPSLRFAGRRQDRRRGRDPRRRRHDQRYFTGIDQASVNRAVADLSATGMFTKVSRQDRRRQGDRHRRRERAGHQPRRLRGQQQAQGRPARRRSPVEGAHAPSTKTAADADVDRIKDAYKKIGRSDVTVTYRLVNLPNGRVDLVFKIDEGDKTGIKSINFVGNNDVSNWRLHSLMQTTEMNFLSWFKTSDVYNPDTLASDEEAIRKYYMKYGYADFRIINTDVVYRSRGRRATSSPSPSTRGRSITSPA